MKIFNNVIFSSSLLLWLIFHHLFFLDFLLFTWDMIYVFPQCLIFIFDCDLTITWGSYFWLVIHIGINLICTFDLFNTVINTVFDLLVNSLRLCAIRACVWTSSGIQVLWCTGIIINFLCHLLVFLNGHLFVLRFFVLILSFITIA